MKRFLSILIPSFLVAQAAHGGTRRVIAESHRAFPSLLPGKIIHIQKTYDPETGETGLVSNSPHIKSPNDLVLLENEEFRALRARYGSLAESLREKFDSMEDDDSLKVLITSRLPPGIRYLNKFDHTEPELEEHSRRIAEIQPVRDIEEVLQSEGVGRFDKHNPGAASATLSKRQLRTLMAHAHVASIGFHTEYHPAALTPIRILPSFFGQATTPVSSLAASAWSHGQDAPPSSWGASIRVATYEFGLDQPFLNCTGLTPSLWQPFAGGDLNHSLLTFRCMTYAIRGASYYHRNTYTFGSTADQSFIVNNTIRLASSSTRRDGMSRLRPLTATDPEFLVMDDFAYRSPYPLFVTPTANEGHTFEAHWQSYNSLSVGNVRHSNYNHFEIGEWGGATMTRNPEQRYGGGCLRPADPPGGTYPYCSSDREMPLIVAPGWSPTRFLAQPPDQSGWGAFMTDPCVPGDHTWGTSFSAPTASGMAANVIGAHPMRMYNFPERIRAVLLATAENVTDGEWSVAVDGLDGAGVVNGSSAADFAANHSSSQANGAAAERVVTGGFINSANWNANLTYNIQIPNPRPAGQHLRIVLNWFSNPVIGGGINALSDLDLIWNGPGGGASASWNNSVEIIDVPRSAVADGSVHSVRIAKYVNRIPAGARANLFYYALAWTWVDDHAP